MKKLKNYVALGLAIGAISVGGTSVYAASNSTEATTEKTTTSESTATSTESTETHSTKEGHGKMDLSSFVSQGIIDQATADKITAFMETKKAEWKVEKDKVKAMSDSERQTYRESKKDQQRPDLLGEMVTAGILTQDQADKLKAAMPEREHQKGHGNFKKMDLSSLVTQGVIDQATADKITAYMDTKSDARKAEREKVESMSDSERETYFETKKSETKVNPFDTMVTDGVITQEQADAIKAAMPQKGQKTSTTESETQAQ